MAYANGQLPASALAPVPGGRLRKDAAAAFNAMNAESQRRFGVTLRSEGPLGTYRTVPDQWKLWEAYQHHEGNLAAYPGTSNHGFGLAIDLGTMQMREIVDQIGRPYGWAKAWSDAPGEWWHLKYRPGVWSGRVPRAPVNRTDAIAIVQQLLRAHGGGELAVNGKLDAETRSALKAFQRAHHLPATGRPDGRTVKALRAASPTHTPAGGGPRHESAPVHPVVPVQPVRRPRRRPHTGHPQHPHTVHRDHTGDHDHVSQRDDTGHHDHTHTDRTGRSIHTGPTHPHKDTKDTKDPFDPRRFPINRLVALLGPFITVLAATLAAWLSQNFPGLIPDDDGATEDTINQGVTFVVAAVLTWAVQHKYLSGWQNWETGLVQLELQRRRHEHEAAAPYADDSSDDYSDDYGDESSDDYGDEGYYEEADAEPEEPRHGYGYASDG